ncbi:MAG: hypothetical protein R3F17_03180 [Planctomycetota bacterium]
MSLALWALLTIFQSPQPIEVQRTRVEPAPVAEQLPFTQSGPIHGRVIDEHTDPVEGVPVLVFRGRDFATCLRTDAQGRFRLDSLKTEDAVWVLIPTGCTAPRSAAANHLEWGEDWDLGELALQRKADITLDLALAGVGRRAPTEVTLECLGQAQRSNWGPTGQCLLFFGIRRSTTTRRAPRFRWASGFGSADPIPGQSSDQRHADSSFDALQAQCRTSKQSVEITAPGRYVWHYRLAEGHQQFPFQWDGVRPSLYFAPQPQGEGASIGKPWRRPVMAEHRCGACNPWMAVQ